MQKYRFPQAIQAAAVALPLFSAFAPAMADSTIAQVPSALGGSLEQVPPVAKSIGSFAAAFEDTLESGLALVPTTADTSNGSAIVQRGYRNFAATQQTGAGNLSLTMQAGSHHLALVSQTGRGNGSAIFQRGSRNAAAVIQSGGGNRALVIQE